MSNPIRFISDREHYGWMSNFWYCKELWIDGLKWKTTEHFFQYEKVIDWDRNLANRIREAHTPAEAKKLAREMPLSAHPSVATKVNIMREALAAKFMHSELRDKLLATGDDLIEEDAPWDSFWGTGKDGKGQNMMGKLLMELRKKLRDEEKSNA